MEMSGGVMNCWQQLHYLIMCTKMFVMLSLSCKSWLLVFHKAYALPATTYNKVCIVCISPLIIYGTNTTTHLHQHFFTVFFFLFHLSLIYLSIIPLLLVSPGDWPDSHASSDIKQPIAHRRCLCQAQVSNISAHSELNRGLHNKLEHGSVKPMDAHEHFRQVSCGWHLLRV